ncbi:MAG TPA: phospholipase D-like domain-containing protein [Steroidobacteraceae bacterium]|jgi:phosphatidylserine/phosphatidylglycerophosphate/cardiolipin synthase-like enzyme|nr:phospholipase D-like domain-containing protein [Steroidobacteraceae bacterium]
MLWRISLIAIAAVWAASAFWQAMKTLPPGARMATGWYSVPAAQVGFLADTTAADAYGRPVVSQAIFDQMLALVHGARSFIVLDYYLFNDDPPTAPDAATPTRALSKELRDALLARRRADPELKILFVTDPINTGPGGVPSNDFAMLRAAGVDLVVTDRRRLRDASFLIAHLWRLTIGRWRGHGRLESANHRRTLIADDGHGGLVGIIGSADPRDSSSPYSNVAVKVIGPVLAPLLASELAIARFSGWRGALGPAPSPPPQEPAPLEARTANLSIATESAVRAGLLERIRATVKGDAIDIAMYHIADRAVIESLLAANSRGVRVRLVLDPSKNTAGEASIPNGPVASELVTASDGAIHVRWYRTHGEEFHTKLVMIRGAARFWATLGSADLTRRNLADYDLNANVAVETVRGAPLALQMSDYFDTLWSNRASGGVEYSADFGVYAEPSQARYWLYRLMDWTGLASF